jgi:hypothetical protein
MPRCLSCTGAGSGDELFPGQPQERDETFEAHFRVTGKRPNVACRNRHLRTVSYRIENGETVIAMSLGRGSVHVVFRKPAPPMLMIKKLVPSALLTLDGAWKVAFQPGRGAPATVLPKLQPLNENADAGIAHFSGVATYAKDFPRPRGGSRASRCGSTLAIA